MLAGVILMLALHLPGAVVADGQAAQTSAPTKPETPEGIAGLRIGMTLDEAKAAVPGIQFSKEQSPADPTPAPFEYAETTLSGQDLGPVENCDARLMFFRKRFIIMQVTCPDKTALEEYLVSTYGPPGQKFDTYWEWTGGTRSMTFSPIGGMINVADNFGNRDFQFTLLAAQGQAQPGGTPPPVPATPQP